MLLNKNRGSIEILAGILSIANPEAKTTQILYRANLSHMLLRKYVGLLMENGLLKKDGNVFYRTEKGLDFVAKYTELKRLLNSHARAKLVIAGKTYYHYLLFDYNIAGC